MLAITAAEVGRLFGKLKADKRSCFTPEEEEEFEAMFSDYCHYLITRNLILDGCV
jgi:hypothetical protein